MKSVSNELQVVAVEKAERVAEKDGDLKEAVEKRLGSLENLGGSKIKVEVSDGVARLSGSIDSQVNRLSALTTARGTSGVRAVLDDLELAPPAVSSRWRLLVSGVLEERVKIVIKLSPPEMRLRDVQKDPRAGQSTGLARVGQRRV